MLYAKTANGSVGHVVVSQSTENDTVTTVCGKTIDAVNLNMVSDVDVCKQCDGKADTLVEDLPDVVVDSNEVEYYSETHEEAPEEETSYEGH